jgi:AcrR family transcriptional regulator
MAPRTRPKPKPAYHHGDLRRALIESAQQLLAEEQNWTFSLREVARRAGVSHNAPYNHFADKRELLAEVAAVGFTTLRSKLRAAAERSDRPEEVFVQMGIAYVRFGTQNPAHYRLMYGSELFAADGTRPEAVESASALSRAALRDAVLECARTGVFPGLRDDPQRAELAVIAAWSMVHGLTSAWIDGIAPRALTDMRGAVEHVARIVAAGLMHPDGEPSAREPARSARKRA